MIEELIYKYNDLIISIDFPSNTLKESTNMQGLDHYPPSLAILKRISLLREVSKILRSIKKFVLPEH